MNNRSPLFTSKKATSSPAAVPSQSELKQPPRTDANANISLWSIIGAGLLAFSIVSLVVYFIQRLRLVANKPKPMTPTEPFASSIAQSPAQPYSSNASTNRSTIKGRESAIALDGHSIPPPIGRTPFSTSVATPENTVLITQGPSYRYITLIILLVSLALLFVTQYILNLAYWFDLDLTRFGFLTPLACIWPDFCNVLRFPPYGFVALLSTLLAATIFSRWLTWQKIPNLLAEPGFQPVQIPSRASLNYQIDGSLVGIFGLCQAYVIVQAIQDQPVFPGIWLLGLLSLLFIGWRLDRSRSGTTRWQMLSSTVLNVLYVSGIASLLLTAAALHTQRWLWIFIFGSATVLLWARVLLSNWRSWDGPSRLERISLALITLGSFLLFSYGLDNWAWSFLGDEYSFYDLAYQFANGTMIAPILSSAGVYEVHPVLSSVWQGTTMWLFGSDGYGWRVSHSLLLALSIPFLYYFLRPILGRTGGLFAVTLYGSAHVLLSFGHVGSNNVQVIFAMATALAAFVWAGRRGSWTGFVLVGICLGLGFYMFAVARIYSLVIAVWLTIYYFPINLRDRHIIWSNTGVWLAVAGTTLLTALPVLSTRSAWLVLARQTVLTSEVAFTPYNQFIQFLQNTFYGLTAFLFNNQNDIWVFGAHADPITSTLMVLGLGAMLMPSKQTRRVRISLLVSYVIFVIIIAGTQQYGYPSISRIFTFVPFYAIFASIGLLAIYRSIMTSPNRNMAGRQSNSIFTVSVLIVAALIVPLNIWQSDVLSQQRSQQRYPAFLLQAAQMSADETGAGPHLFYVGDPQHEYWARVIYSVYGIPLDRFTFVLTRDTLVPNNVICQSADQPAIVMITTEISEAGYIATGLRECWPGSELRLIKDVRNSAIQYRLINKSALPFIHSAGGYWLEEELPQTTFTQAADDRFAWTVYLPVGLSQNSKGQLAIVELGTNQVVFLDSSGHNQSILENAFVYAADVSFLPDDGFIVADAGQGLLWFDQNGHFRFKSYGGDSPRGVFVAADGTVYVASTGSRFILQVKSSGETLRIIKGSQFGQPTSVAVAVDGRIAVGDPVLGKVTINSSTGKLLAEYPIGVGDTGIDKPGLLWLQDGGFIYTDPVNNRMIWLDPDGKTFKEWSNLKTPTDILLQSKDKLLVLESFDHHILSIELK